ncbi:hypothetical protein JVT61DRAFT_6418 [Boletus reticuloceps]|uniref:Uncharacterized protein n=1 Tax=Boletus reticuloceps TaxID=495285 RepID=A0A8I2YJZ9_9AGAM|nr:hypothetical protein JVT61DRAFT_6418 [Boletus reticuloceps]
MVAPSCLRIPSETQPAELSPRRTRPSNATAHPGLPDKPTPRCTSKEKHADKEKANEVKEAKKFTLKGAYQLIFAMQAEMAKEQTEGSKSRATVHPKPCVIKKEPQLELPMILDSWYPHKYCQHTIQTNSQLFVLTELKEKLVDKRGLREILAEATHQQILETGSNSGTVAQAVSARTRTINADDDGNKHLIPAINVSDELEQSNIY